MTTDASPTITIKGARTNNLKNVSLCIPHHRFVVVTGVSGSGKSSLVFELIAKEGQRRYFETLPTFARQFIGKLNRPEVDAIEGLAPVIAIGQRTSGLHARSTVGTLSDIYDLLRLLYARTGKTETNTPLTRALFSFNSVTGKCPRCNGIGREEIIDLNRLISEPEKTIREGALAPTLPNGYIMYSQVTIDVLNQVCEAEGFSVDIPWNELTEAQRRVVLYGSEKIKVPFGKHSLESRLKWTGIKAKPREEGYYKGMIPIMSDILRRDRNANILKYVHAVTCRACCGARLNENALSVSVHDKSIAEVVRMELHELQTWLHANEWDAVGQRIVGRITAQTKLLIDLGLGHLIIERSAATLRAGEIQRIRVANQILAPLSDVVYVFDEPSVGLHRAENERLIYHMRQLVAKGNTVIVVEHDLDTIRNADHLIEIGPQAGTQGGEVLFNGPLTDFSQRKALADSSPTYRALTKIRRLAGESPQLAEATIRLYGCNERNLKNIDVAFQMGRLNVVSGRSGAGKTSLVVHTLLGAVQQELGTSKAEAIKLTRHENLDRIDQLIFIDHSPIGRTPRSNPATYLGISDPIRDLYASMPAAKERGFTKARFSFNNKGGRCETCQGAGKIQVGMHFLGKVDLECGTCQGDRFSEAILEVEYRELSIAQVYRLSVTEAVDFFADQPKILKGLQVLQDIGLGYLTLGQSSTTLSGGEAQRIKIANQLQKKDTGNTLYIIIEPSIGLHYDNIDSLLRLFDRIKQKGNTIVCIEQDETVISNSDWHLELGPGNGSEGGRIIHQGPPNTTTSVTPKPILHKPIPVAHSREIVLQGVTTHGLKNIDVRIPKNQLTVVTGLSGSGKSALVYDTLFAAANARFTESLSPYYRSFLQQNSTAEIAHFSGLGPAIGMNRRGRAASARATVGTLSGIHASLRILYSRIAQRSGANYTAQHFSFNHQLGACPTCAGLGVLQKCDPDQVIVASDKSILDGAASGNKAVKYYADPDGQFIATLLEAARQNDWDLTPPWQALDPHVQHAILYGTGDTVWATNWTFRTKSRSGTQSITAKWQGLCHYIDQEYQRKRHNKNIQELQVLLHNVTCPVCQGSRLRQALLQTSFLEKNIQELSQMSIAKCLALLSTATEKLDAELKAISSAVLPSVIASLRTLCDLGLGYLSLNRAIPTLSGGERQRVTLAGQLSSQLYGVTYVLDEPTIGLDREQVGVLIKKLKHLVSKGNTVVVVEHDPGFIRNADYLIEMGPGAGRKGGEVMYQGVLSGLMNAQETLTWRLLQEKSIQTVSRKTREENFIGVKGAAVNNLKKINVNFYTGQLIAVTGVSGSGKSSLIKEVLYRSSQAGRATNCASIEGLSQFSQVLLIDQKPPAQNRWSTPLSYTGLLGPIQAAFAKTPVARNLGLKKADFSYQSKNGKCPVCAGYGQLKTSLDFLSDIWLTCDVCRGLRYNERVLACILRGRSIGEVLQMTVEEAQSFFTEQPILAQLEVLHAVGVGHLLLGQAGHTLSGGEAQRLKLATALLQKRTGPTLFLFDEPSTGLHYFDILKLIDVFQSLAKRGDTVLYIEHNRTLIAAAGQVIRLGPGSGADGGRIMT